MQKISVYNHTFQTLEASITISKPKIEFYEANMAS